MIIETIELNKDKKAHRPSQKALNMAKVFDYIKQIKDGSIIKNDVIKKIQFIENTDHFTVFLENMTFQLNTASLRWLETHHFMVFAIHNKLTLEELWDMIEKDVDLFVIEDYWIKREKEGYGEDRITYDRNTIFVNNVNTFLPTNHSNFQFVRTNINRWLID